MTTNNNEQQPHVYNPEKVTPATTDPDILTSVTPTHFEAQIADQGALAEQNKTELANLRSELDTIFTSDSDPSEVVGDEAQEYGDNQQLTPTQSTETDTSFAEEELAIQRILDILDEYGNENRHNVSVLASAREQVYGIRQRLIRLSNSIEASEPIGTNAIRLEETIMLLISTLAEVADNNANAVILEAVFTKNSVRLRSGRPHGATLSDLTSGLRSLQPRFLTVGELDAQLIPISETISTLIQAKQRTNVAYPKAVKMLTTGSKAIRL